MKKTYAVVSALVLSYGVSNAQEFNKVASTAAQFLKIETGARAQALGGSYAALANDPYALYWNVAGIAKMDRIGVAFSYSNWIADYNHYFAGVVLPVGQLGNIGFSVLSLTSDSFEQTTIEQPRGTGVIVNASDIAIGVSYAKNMFHLVSVGITAKYIQQNLWDVSAETVALDIGLQLDTGFNGIKVGMSLKNFGPEMTLGGRNLIRGLDQNPQNNSNPLVQTSLETASWPLPTSYNASIAMEIVGGESSLVGVDNPNNLIVAVDISHPNDNPEHYSVGAEYSFNNIFFGRIGYKGRTDEQGLTFGAGLLLPLGKKKELHLDYAHSDFGTFDSVEQFSFYITF
ncbi:MAG: PorV/PorQ family protein [bacterium]